MTTQLNPAIVVEATGLILACAWCLSPAQLAALSRAHPKQVSHSLCPTCRETFERDVA